MPALFFTRLALYPLTDRWITGAPADLANRTAAGVAGVTFYGLLWAAAANDEIAYHLQVPLYTVTWIFRVLVLAGPPLAFGLTRVIAHARGALDGRRRNGTAGKPAGSCRVRKAATPGDPREPARQVPDGGPGVMIKRSGHARADEAAPVEYLYVPSCSHRPRAVRRSRAAGVQAVPIVW